MARRMKGDGSIYKRKDGRWCAAYYVGNSRKFLYGKTQKDVRDKLKQLKYVTNEGKYSFSDMTLEKCVYEFLTKYKVNEIKESTYNTYMIFYRKHIKDSNIGNIKIQELVTDDIQGFYNEKMKQGLSATTVRHISVLVREALAHAVRLRYIVHSPHEAVILPKKEQYETSILSVDDVKKLVKMAKYERIYPLIMTALFSGMRKGELLALSWENVDLQKGSIYVRKSLCRVADYQDEKGVYHTKVVLLDPKTKSSKRIIPISNFLIGVLKEHKEKQEDYKNNEAKDFYKADSDIVFANYWGNYMSEREVLNEFYKVLDKYEIPRVRFHDLRHTFTSLMLNSSVNGCENINPQIVQEVLGHSSITTTLGTYSHLMKSQKQDSINKLDRLIIG